MMTVACVWVRGHVPFTAEYVFKLRSMVARHLPEEHRFVCLTDRAKELPGIETIPAQAPAGCKAWWAKLKLFDPDLGLTGRVLYLDLDTLVVASLMPIVRPEPARMPYGFSIAPHAGTFRPPRHVVVPRYNSSVMVFDSWAVPVALWEHWTPRVAKRLWGDQDWIGEQLPKLPTMPAKWFPRISECPDGPPKDARVVLMKKPKNAEAARLYPWVRELWG